MKPLFDALPKELEQKIRRFTCLNCLNEHYAEREGGCEKHCPGCDGWKSTGKCTCKGFKPFGVLNTLPQYMKPFLLQLADEEMRDGVYIRQGRLNWYVYLRSNNVIRTLTLPRVGDEIMWGVVEVKEGWK